MKVIGRPPSKASFPKTPLATYRHTRSGVTARWTYAEIHAANPSNTPIIKPASNIAFNRFFPSEFLRVDCCSMQMGFILHVKVILNTNRSDGEESMEVSIERI